MKKQLYLLLTAIITLSLSRTTIFANDKKPAIINESAMFIDGEQIWGTGFNVGGNNYFKLRDMAANTNCRYRGNEHNRSFTCNRIYVLWNDWLR
ncbi:MAG TPA: hypothetical protein GX707_13115 [Epulopiscium sp.]|nr:hypothetical protein [Candidatus Epulonipiscium sp.]